MPAHLVTLDLGDGALGEDATVRGRPTGGEHGEELRVLVDASTPPSRRVAGGGSRWPSIFVEPRVGHAERLRDARLERVLERLAGDDLDDPRRDLVADASSTRTPCPASWPGRDRRRSRPCSSPSCVVGSPMQSAYGRPCVCESSWRTVIARFAPLNSGRYVATGSSSETLPSSTSVMSVAAVSHLLADAIGITERGVERRRSRLRWITASPRTTSSTPPARSSSSHGRASTGRARRRDPCARRRPAAHTRRERARRTPPIAASTRRHSAPDHRSSLPRAVGVAARRRPRV